MAEGLTLPALAASFRAASMLKKATWTAMLLLVLAALGFFMLDRQPEYRVLFANLSDRDGGAVVDALERLDIPYRLAEPGGAVEVPANQLHVARYKLAAQGLPKGDNREAEATSVRGFGLSQFQEQIGYQHALEDELAKSVAALDGVSSARVHLALPKQTSFLRERIPPAASVLIKLRPAASFDEEQVESIRHIVANSVPGMAAAQVSVVDQTGTLLAAGVAGHYRGLSPDQLEYARRIEGEYAERLVKMLSPVLGSSAFKVQVTALIDFSETESTIESARQSGKSTVYTHKTMRHVREPKGEIKRLSALVVVDEAAGMDKSRLDRLERLARQAVGFDSRRRDSVQVIKIPFATLPASEPQPISGTESLRNLNDNKVPAELPADAGEPWPVYAGIALAILSGLFLTWMLIKRSRPQADATSLAEEESLSPGERFETELDIIRQRVMQDPKVAASVVKLWMNA